MGGNGVRRSLATPWLALAFAACTLLPFGCGGTARTSTRDGGSSPCGGAGQACCDGTACNDALACVSALCTSPSDDGGIGDATVDVSVDAIAMPPDAGDATGATTDVAVEASVDATLDAAPEAGCTAGTLACNGAQPTICTAGGTQQSVGAPCAGSTPFCLGGACVVCSPNATRCSGSGVETCMSDGSWGTAVQCAQPVPDCVSGACACAETMCGGACADLKTDPNNCNVCSHSCQGGACSAGMCQPVVLVSGQLGTNASLLVTGGSIYWSSPANAIMSVPVSGGTPSTVTATDPVWIVDGLAAAGTTLYYAGGGDGVLAAPLAGGTSVTLYSNAANNYAVSAVATDGTNVYWVEENNVTGATSNVVELPLAAGTPTTLVSLTEHGIRSLAVDATTVYWDNPLAPGSLESTPIAGGGMVTTLASGLGNPKQLTVYGSTVYLVNAGLTANAGAVLSIPSGGGSVTTMAANQAFPQYVAVDSSGVYWTTGAGGDAVLTKSLGGGMPTTLAGNLSSGVAAIALDSTSVYWNGVQLGIVKLAKP